MVLHQDLAVLRSCSLFFLLSLFSCPAAVSLSIMPSCVRSTLGARAPQWEGGCRRWDARPPQCRGSRQWCAGVGRPPILPPFPFENVSRWCWPECRLSPCFWSLDYLPLEYCLMVTVNVMASNRHLRWWSPPVWFVGLQTVGRVIVCPWSGEQVVALPSVSDVCWSCLSLVVPVGADTGASPQLPWLASDFKDGCLPASWVRVYVWLYPAVPCTWHGYGSLEPARPCSRWPRHLVHAWSGVVECMTMRWQRSCANSCLLVT